MAKRRRYTMTVKELIEELQKRPPESDVFGVYKYRNGGEDGWNITRIYEDEEDNICLECN